MDHLVQFTISIDDAHIAQMVEQKAAKALENEVLKVCKSQVGCEANYWGDNEPGPVLKKVVEDFMKDNREEIIDKAADKLAEGLSRTKIVKEAAAKVLKERIKKLDEAEDAKFREAPVKGPLYGTRSDAIFVDEFVGEVEK